MTGGDEDLRNRFLALRRELEEQAPAFRVRSRPVRVRGYGRVKIIAAACLAVCFAAVVWWQEPVFQRSQEKPVAPLSSIAEWRAPTEFLLDTPGGDLLRSVPAFGADVDLGNALEPGQKRRKHAKSLLKRSASTCNRRLSDPAGAKALLI